MAADNNADFSGNNARTLGDVVKLLDDQKSDYEAKLSSFISEESRSLVLTHAERILLYEGSQTGVADCTVPPYILYENFSEPDDACIRAELLEWMLDSVVSRAVLRSGFIRIRGAKIMASSDHTAEKYIPYLLDPRKSDHSHERDERYSLDLSSRNITVDLAFDNCHFIRGIKLQDSYTENMIFERCTIGVSKDVSVKYSGDISINAANTNVKGDLLILYKPKERHHKEHKKYNMAGSILLTAAIIDNLLKLDGVGVNGKIDAMHLKAETVNLSNSAYYAAVDFNSGKIEKLFCIDSELYDTFNTYNLKAETVDLNNSDFYEKANLSFAKIEKLFCEKSKFYGYPISLEAPGLQSNAVFLRGDFVALFGAALHKSKIEGDFDCSGGFFGPCYIENSYGMALSVGGSSIGNAYFADSFTSVGLLDISNTVISGSVYFRKGTFLNYNKPGAARQAGQFKYAIFAHNMFVQQRVTFNPPKLYNRETPRIGNHRLHHLLALHLYYVCRQSDNLQNFVKEFDDLIKKEIPKTGDESQELDNSVDDWLNRIKGLLEVQTEALETLEVLRLLESNRKGVEDIKDFLKKKRPDLSGRANEFAFVYGEAYFEEAHINGHMDCAGAVFYLPKHYDDGHNYKVNDWYNALTISYAKINGVLYLNNGDKENKLPMLVKGEVDLQYAYFNQLFICPALASDDKENTRWKLIGTKYEAVTSDRKSKNKSLAGSKWIHYYKGEENNHQPFEQLSATLYKNGDDILARKVIIHAPQENKGQKWLMRVIGIVSRLSLPAYKSAIALGIFWVIGIFVFHFAAQHDYIISIDTDKALIREESLLKPAVAQAGDTVVYFNACAYSAERLIPVLDLDQKEFFKRSYQQGLLQWQDWHYLLYPLYFMINLYALSVFMPIYFFIHPLAGTLFLAIFLIGIARIRRNS